VHRAAHECQGNGVGHHGATSGFHPGGRAIHGSAASGGRHGQAEGLSDHMFCSRNLYGQIEPSEAIGSLVGKGLNQSPSYKMRTQSDKTPVWHILC
jgi:hypothetical protein